MGSGELFPPTANDFELNQAMIDFDVMRDLKEGRVFHLAGGKAVIAQMDDRALKRSALDPAIQSIDSNPVLTSPADSTEKIRCIFVDLLLPLIWCNADL